MYLRSALSCMMVIGLGVATLDDPPPAPPKGLKELQSELDRLAAECRSDAASTQKADAAGQALEAGFRAVRRAMVRAACDATTLEALERFDQRHPSLVERLVSSDALAVCQGLRQLEQLQDERAGPYIAYFLREPGPIGDFALQASLKCSHPAVIAGVIERLGGPRDIRDLFGTDNAQHRNVTIFHADQSEPDPLFATLAAHKAAEAVPVLLALLEYHLADPQRFWFSPRPGDETTISQTLSAIGDARAVGAMVKLMRDNDKEHEGGFFGRVFFGGGDDREGPDPLFQAILELAGETPRNYGMKSGDGMVHHWHNGGGITEMLVFRNPDDRKAGRKQFDEWWKTHGEEEKFHGIRKAELPDLPEPDRTPPLPVRAPHSPDPPSPEDRERME